MLTDVEHKASQGWYESIVLLEDKEGNDRFIYEDNTFPIAISKNIIHETLPITCVACLGLNHNEDDFFAVYSKCEKTKHPFCHTCFNQKCVKTFTYSQTKGPNRIMMFEGCTICNVHDGVWRNAKYSPKLRRWQFGKILPDGINILAFHQRMWKPELIDRDAVQYNNYITSPFLLSALMRNNGINIHEIRQQYPVSDWEYNVLLKTYNKGNATFKCMECNKSKKQVNQCKLRSCNSNCEYSFCRDCFLHKITSSKNTRFTTYNYQNGLLNCTTCKRSSRAIFRHTGRYVSSGDRNKLLYQMRNKNFFDLSA